MQVHDSTWASGWIEPEALDDALETITQRIEQSGEGKKAVISFSSILPVDMANVFAWEELFRVHFQQLDLLGVSWVQSTMDTVDDQPGLPQRFLGYLIPQKFGSANNSIITVGGTDTNGRFWPSTILEGPPSSQAPGEITVWAQADNIQSLDNTGSEVRRVGADLASPQVVRNYSSRLTFVAMRLTSCRLVLSRIT
jgi:hypothetical protein